MLRGLKVRRSISRSIWPPDVTNEHKTNKNKESVVSLHPIENKHEFDWENISVLDMESNYKKRLVSEIIYIKSNHNSINKKEDIQKSNVFSYYQRI